MSAFGQQRTCRGRFARATYDSKRTLAVGASPDALADTPSALRQGLKDTGYVEGEQSNTAGRESNGHKVDRSVN
jgi:hypothetical protein